MKKARTPNHEIITSLGIMPFWETIQCAANAHYHNLYVKDWDMNNTMSAVVDNDKVHLNYKTPADNFRSTCHVRDNRLGIANHTAALTGTNLILCNEYEKIRRILQLF